MAKKGSAGGAAGRRRSGRAAKSPEEEDVGDGTLNGAGTRRSRLEDSPPASPTSSESAEEEETPPKRRGRPAKAAARGGAAGAHKRGRGRRSIADDEEELTGGRGRRKRPSVSFKETSDVEDEEEQSDRSDGSDEEASDAEMAVEEQDVVDDTVYAPSADALVPRSSTLELGRSGASVAVPASALGDLAAAYAVIRAFSWQLRLSPFPFEDFCAAMCGGAPTVLIDEVHVSVLRALAMDEVPEERTEHKLDVSLIDHMTWPAFVWEWLRITEDPLAKHEWAQRVAGRDSEDAKQAEGGAEGQESGEKPSGGDGSGGEANGTEAAPMDVDAHPGRPRRAFEPVDPAAMDAALATGADAAPADAAAVFGGAGPTPPPQQMEYYSLPADVKAAILLRLTDHLLDTPTVRAEIDRREEEGNWVAGRGGEGGAFPIMTPEEKERAETRAQRNQMSDANTDACVLCGIGGNLLCCDGCPAAYHMRCIGATEKSIGEGDWMCPECAVGGRGEAAGLRIPVGARNKWKQPMHLLNGTVIRTELPAVRSRGSHAEELTSRAAAAAYVGTAAEEELEGAHRVRAADEIPLSSSFDAVAEPPRIPVAEGGACGPEAYVNRYKNGWTAAAAAVRTAAEESKRRKGKAGMAVPTGTCGRLTLAEMPEPLTLSRFQWVQMQGRPVGRNTSRCGKCHTCLRPTLRKGCLNPISKPPAPAAAAAPAAAEDGAAPAAAPVQDTSKLSYLIAYTCKMEREFWGLAEGPWAEEPGGGMQFRSRWAAGVRAASTASEVAQALLQFESVLRPVAFDASWYGEDGAAAGAAAGAATATQGASQPGSRTVSRTTSMADVGAAGGEEEGGAGGASGAGAPSGGRQRGPDPYDLRFDKGEKAEWEMDRKHHAARATAVNRLPRAVLKRAVRAAGRQPIPGIRYKKLNWRLVSPRMQWIAEMEAAQTCAQLALAVRRLDAALRWEDAAKPRVMAPDAPYANASVLERRSVVEGAREYEYQIEKRTPPAAEAAAAAAAQQQMAIFQQRLAMNQAAMMAQAQAMAARQANAAAAAAAAGQGLALVGLPPAAPSGLPPLPQQAVGRLGSLNQLHKASEGGLSGLGAPSLPQAAASGTAPAAPAPAAVPPMGIIPPAFAGFAGLMAPALGTASAFALPGMPGMQGLGRTLGPSAFTTVLPPGIHPAFAAPAAPPAKPRLPPRPLLKPDSELNEDEKLVREIVKEAILKGVELNMPAAMAAKLRSRHAGGGASSGDLQDAGVATPSGVAPSGAAGHPSVPSVLAPLLGLGGQKAGAPKEDRRWVPERELPLWFVRGYEESLRRDEANQAARELQAAARRGGGMDAGLQAAARQAARAAAAAAADACGICAAAQGESPDLDALWICCDTCNRWFHGGCVAMSQDDVDAIAEDESWDCPGCANARRKAERAARREGKPVTAAFSPFGDLEPGSKRPGRPPKPFYERADYKAGEAKMLERLRRGEGLGEYSAGRKRGRKPSGPPETEEEAAARAALRAERAKRKREEAEAAAAAAAEPIHCPVCQYPDYGRPLVECGSCQRWFHGECSGASAEEVAAAMAGGADLHCAECQGKRVRPPTQAAIDAAILTAAEAAGVEDPRGGSSKRARASDAGASTPAPKKVHSEATWRDAAARVLTKTSRLAAAEPFTEPVTEEEAPDYFDVIVQPMDLGTLRRALPGLTAPMEVLAGVKLIVDNCIQYNGDDSDFAEVAADMHRGFMKYWTGEGLPLTAEEWAAQQVEAAQRAAAGVGSAGPRSVGGPGKGRGGINVSVKALEPAAGAVVAADWRPRAAAALAQLMALPEAEHFLEPVPRGFLNYHDVITKPMDLGTVAQRLSAGRYTHPADMAVDVAQTWANCRIFNEPDAPVAVDAASAEAAFVRAWHGAGVYQGGVGPPPGLAATAVGGAGAAAGLPAGGVRGGDWRESAQRVLRRVINHVSQAAWFAAPVSDDDVPGYSEVIEYPMDLGTALEQLKAGMYVSPLQLAADIELIWSNAEKFNGPDHPVTAAAQKTAAAFQKHWESSGLQRMCDAIVNEAAAAQQQQQQVAMQAPAPAPYAAAPAPPPAQPAAPSAPPSDDWVAAARAVLSAAMQMPEAAPFIDPPSDPAAAAGMPRPMSFGMVMTNLGRGRYASPEAVLADVRSIAASTAVAHGPTSPLTAAVAAVDAAVVSAWRAAGLPGV